MTIEAARRNAAEDAGKRIENNVRMEIRVGFAKDILIPPISRFTAEAVAALKPLDSWVIKPLTDSWTRLNDGYDYNENVKNILEDKGIIATDILNLGGFNVVPDKNKLALRKYVTVMFGYHCAKQQLITAIIVSPKIDYPQDLFTVCAILLENKISMPTFVLKDGSKASYNHFKATQKGVYNNNEYFREFNIMLTDLALPLVDSEAVYSFAKNMWNMVGDVAFDVTI